MAGHGEKLSRKQEQAVAALLAHPTIEAAATACGVSQRTLRNWLAEPAFRAAFLAARRQVVEQTVTRLQQASTKAVDTLEGALDCDSPGVQVRAALGILEQTYRGVELLDLEARLAALEEQHGRRRARPAAIRNGDLS